MSEENAASRTWTSLNARERRVLGVLVEKQKTTPEYYPMTVAGIVSGSNQKSNRDPQTNYDADDVEDILLGLRKKGAVVTIEGMGRAPKWKHTLYEWLDLKNKPTELAVLAELMLRGPQTEGELRARASRMDAIADLPALATILEFLTARGLVVYLTPAGQKRGVVVSHGLYPPEELERVRQHYANMPIPGPEPEERVATRSGGAERAAELAALRADVDELREQVKALQEELRAVKAALGE